MGDAGLGIISAWHYDYKSTTPRNVEFVKLFNEMHGRNPDFFSIGGYDGMHAIYETLKKTGGKTDGDSLIAAAKGLKWESPRGPMSIDPETRDVVQTIYIRRVEKVGGELVNVPFDKIENVKDPTRRARRMIAHHSGRYRGEGAAARSCSPCRDVCASDCPIAGRCSREDSDAKDARRICRAVAAVFGTAPVKRPADRSRSA